MEKMKELNKANGQYLIAVILVMFCLVLFIGLLTEQEKQMESSIVDSAVIIAPTYRSIDSPGSNNIMVNYFAIRGFLEDSNGLVEKFDNHFQEIEESEDTNTFSFLHLSNRTQTIEKIEGVIIDGHKFIVKEKPIYSILDKDYISGEHKGMMMIFEGDNHTERGSDKAIFELLVLFSIIAIIILFVTGLIISFLWIKESQQIKFTERKEKKMKDKVMEDIKEDK